MKAWLGLTALAAALALSACAATEPKEVVDILMTPSIDVSGYRTWAFDLDACVDTGHPEIDDAFLHAHLLEEIESYLASRGYAQRSEGPVDFRVYYTLQLDQIDVHGPGTARVLFRIHVFDEESGRRVWMGEMKAVMAKTDRTAEERALIVRETVRERMQYFAPEQPGI